MFHVTYENKSSKCFNEFVLKTVGTLISLLAENMNDQSSTDDRSPSVISNAFSSQRIVERRWHSLISISIHSFNFLDERFFTARYFPIPFA